MQKRKKGDVNFIVWLILALLGLIVGIIIIKLATGQGSNLICSIFGTC